MKKIILLIVGLTNLVYSWEINTQREKERGQK